MKSELRNRLLIIAIVTLVAFGLLYPTLKLSMAALTDQPVTGPVETPFSKPISLGLDLSGGVYLVYEVQANEAVKSALQVQANSLRNELRKAKIAITRVQVNEQNQIEFSLYSEKNVEKARTEIEGSGSGLTFVRDYADEGKRILVYGISQEETEQRKNTAILNTIETLRARVDAFGVSEPLIQRVGHDRIMLQMPGVKDIESVKKVVGKIAKLEFRYLPDPGSTVGRITLRDRQGAPIEVEDELQMGGDAVADANVEFLNSQLQVSLTFTREGGRTFGQVTSGSNVGRHLAIILDGVVYSSPEILERISGGRCQITGGFSIDEAKQLAVVLRAGALPAPLKEMQEATVGPTLGAQSIKNGVTAVFAGFVLIFLFMGIYYRKSGILACATLLYNLILVLAALSAFGATLTLPGIAGLALTVGMAVDANVIIFERIRDELRNGASRDAAVAEGFNKALSAIMDSNITTLLTAIILYYFGSGPIRGFAVTLTIGIFTTVFCATWLAKLGFDALPLMKKETLSI